MSACHASWNMVTQQEIKVLVGFGCFFFFFFFLFFFQYSSSFTPQVLLLSLQAFPDDARIIAAGRGRIAVEGDSNP